MMTHLNLLCDHFYIHMSLNTEMELPASRDTLLHFFELLRKNHPSMRNFRHQSPDKFLLEDDATQETHRWCVVERKRIGCGILFPESMNDAIAMHVQILDTATWALSLTPLDCESLDLIYGFDFVCRGNPSKLLVDTLGVPPMLEPLCECESAKQILHYSPAITIADDGDPRTQIRIHFETQNHLTQKTEEDEILTVFLTVRRYGCPDSSALNRFSVADEKNPTRESTENLLGKTLRYIAACAERIMDEYLVDAVLSPIAQAVAEHNMESGESFADP